MGRHNILKPDFWVPVAFIPEVEKKHDDSDGKSTQIKLTLGAEGNVIANPTTQAQPIFNQGTVKQYLKWINSLNSILQGQSVMELYRFALQSLPGTYKSSWQREWDATSLKLSTVAGISMESANQLWTSSMMNLTVHVLKYACAGYKQKRYKERHLFLGNQAGVRHFID
jgi:hypothetical protein